MERSSSQQISASGIIDDPNAINHDQKIKQRIIPQSRRPDGSLRKERKVRPGFVPVEDVARFVPSRVRKARAEAAFANSNSNQKIIEDEKQQCDSVTSTKHNTSIVEKTSSNLKAEDSPISQQKSSKDVSKELHPSKSHSASDNSKTIKEPTTKEIPDSWDDDEDDANDVQTQQDEPDPIDNITKSLQKTHIKQNK